MLTDELRATFLTDGLSDDQLADLLAVGEEVPFASGDELFREGEPADYLWILLDGHLELSRHSGTDTTAVATTPCRVNGWAGCAWAMRAAARLSGQRGSSDDAALLPSVGSAGCGGGSVRLARSPACTRRSADRRDRCQRELVALGIAADWL
jgi:hypothetical protein